MAVNFPADPHFVVSTDGVSLKVYTTEPALRAYLHNNSLPDHTVRPTTTVARDIGYGPVDKTAEFAAVLPRVLPPWATI